MRFSLATSLKTKTYHSSLTLSDDVYDPDRDFVPLFDFSAPLTGFGDDFMDDDGEKTKINLFLEKNVSFPNLNLVPQSGDPFKKYEQEIGAIDKGFDSNEGFDFMDFSDFEGLQNLEDKDYDTDSSHPEEDIGLREMKDEDMDEEGPNKQLMTRDAWEEDGQPSKFQADEDMGHGKHQDTEKVKKTKKRKSSKWDNFDNEDNQPWTPVTTSRSPAD